MDARSLSIDSVQLDAEIATSAPGGEFLAAHRQLAELNHRYLDLIVAEGGLPESIMQSLRTLMHAERSAIARCPFSLFTLRFDRQEDWLELASGASVGQRLRTPVSSAQSEWVATAVFLAWHLAHTEPLAARILLGMGLRVIEAVRQVPIAGLTNIAIGAQIWLAPRWPQHPHFWPSLIRNSRLGASMLSRSYLLGRQLLAAEVLYAAPLAASAPKRNPNRNLPRLSPVAVAFA